MSSHTLHKSSDYLAPATDERADTPVTGAVRLDIIVFAVLYIIVGHAATVVTSSSVYAPAVQPAVGIAVAAVLTAGYRNWAAAFLGTLALHAIHMHRVDQQWYVAIVIASGTTLGVLLAVYIVRQRCGRDTAFSRASAVAMFVVVGAPAGCLLSSICGAGSLYLFGIVAAEDIVFNWWCWWGGEIIGVVLGAPLVLVVIGRPRDLWRSRRGPIALPLSLSLVLLNVLFASTSELDRDAVRAEFDQRAFFLDMTFRSRLARYVEMIHSVGSLFASSEHVTRAEFQRFTDVALARSPGIQAVSWNPYVLREDRARLVAQAARDGFGGFEFMERNDDGELVRAADRDTYVVVYFIEPYDDNRGALGFDVASDAIRGNTLEHALNAGALTATPAISMVQESGGQRGVVMFLPLFRTVDDDTDTAGRGALRGYVAAVFRMKDMMHAAFRDIDVSNIGIRLLDLDEPEALAAIRSKTTDFRGRGRRIQQSFTHYNLRRITKYDVGGRGWILQIMPGPDYVATHRRWYAWSVPAGNLVFAVLLTGSLLLISGKSNQLSLVNVELGRENAERRAIEMERESLISALESKNDELQRYVYGVSHDLRSPLITIKGFLTLLKRDLDVGKSDDTADYVDRVNEAADVMQLRLDGLLELSRIGHTIDTFETCHLGDITHEALRVLGGRLMDRNIEVTIADTMVIAFGSKARLLDVMQNLLENALKSISDKSGGIIEVGCREDDIGVVCYVKDNGIGLDPRHHQVVFDLFNSLDHSANSTGIGLATVKRIIELHGQRVWVESAGVGAGATFCFTVPRSA